MPTGQTAAERGEAVGLPRSSTWRDAAWRLALRAGFRLALAWWSFRRPPHQGVQAAIWIKDRLLLLQSSYRGQWNFPGGGIRVGEAPEPALRRELMEELGFRPPALAAAGSASGLWEGRHDTVQYFELRLERLPEIRWDNREIVGARLFRVTELARLPLTGPVRAYLADHLQLQSVTQLTVAVRTAPEDNRSQPDRPDTS